MIRYLLALIVASAPLLAQTPGVQPALPAADVVLKYHDTRLAAVKSWQANFIKNITEGSITVVQSGTVRFVRQPAASPNQPVSEKGRADFMMQVKGRDLGYTIVSGDDNIAWQIVSQGNLRGIYKLDMSRPIAGSKEDTRSLNPINEVNPLALLQKFRPQLSFVTDGLQELGSRQLYRLVGKPKTPAVPGQVQIGSLQAWIALDDGFLHRIAVNDPRGNVVLTIDLSAVRFNLPLDDALFLFTPPPNANIQDLNTRLGNAPNYPDTGRTITAKPSQPTKEAENVVFTGTGFFITDDGYLLTNRHVIKDSKQFKARTSLGLLPATVVRVDKEKDIALLKLAGQFSALPIAQVGEAKLGSTVFTIGFPNTSIQGWSPKLTKGEISSLAGLRDDPYRYQISVPIQPGNSGGALVNEYGNVVGIIVSSLNQIVALEKTGFLPQNVNYAIKVDCIRKFLTDLPELTSKLKSPNRQARRTFEDVVDEVKPATVQIVAE